MMKRENYSPPKLFLHFFRWFCHPKMKDYIEGDLMEVYEKRLKKSGKRIADARFIIDVILLFRPGIIRTSEGHQRLNTYGMYKNYFKICFRQLINNKGFAFINITGLALGVMCFTFIVIFVENELSFDRFHDNADHVFRIVKDFVNEDGTRIPDATTPPALATAIRKDLPEAEIVTRFFPAWGRLFLAQSGDKRFYERNVIRVDSNFFSVFDFPIVVGNPAKPFTGIHSMVITESTGRKYFGDQNPLNQIIRLNVNNGTDYVVSAVMRDVPQNSHFTFDLLIPFESRRNVDEDWDFYGFYTYVQLRDGTSPESFEAKVKNLFQKYQPNSLNYYYIQPLSDIHLSSKLKWELAPNGDQLYVNILISIAVFVMLIAGINYVNLVTAQSARRAKEVGVRKVTGAPRLSIIRQFLLESIVTVTISFIVALIIAQLFLPFTKEFLGYDLALMARGTKWTWYILLTSMLAVALLAGIYPAFFLSSFQPIKALKGKYFNTAAGTGLKQGLVVFQFVVSSSLIIGTLVVSGQMDFMKEKKMGFNQENVLLLPNVRGGIGQVYNPGNMVEDLKEIPGVTRIARADGVLGVNNSTNGLSTKNNNARISLNFVRADYDFIPVMEIEIKEGRNFSDQFPSDSLAIILNEKAVEELGLHPPFIGQPLSWDDEQGKTHEVNLVGIVKDFHFTSLHESIKPFGFILEVGNGSTFFLKLQAKGLSNTLGAVEKVWTKHHPDSPFDYSFQDEHLAKLHLSEEKFQKLFSSFTVLAIIIACLGLFGLITYLAESKTKEIGIRKVLGASVNRIVVLLSRDFILLVAIALVIACPLAYYGMNIWLENFAYHINISWMVFVMAGVTSLAMATLTVIIQAIKAALINPSDSLRNE